MFFWGGSFFFSITEQTDPCKHPICPHFSLWIHINPVSLYYMQFPLAVDEALVEVVKWSNYSYI